MKNIALTILLLLATIGMSQESGSGKLVKAKAAYNNFSYSNAINKYELLDLNIDEQRNLANSYVRSNSFEKADSLYEIIVNNENCLPIDYYSYAQILRQNKKYEQSEEWMSKYSEANSADSRGALYDKEKGSYKNLMEDKGQFKVVNLAINSEQQDFGTAYYKDKVVFASSREGNKAIKRRWNWNELPFLDTYIADMDNYELVNPTRFSKKVNKKFHEGPVAFNKEGNMMIFTRNNYEEKANDNIVRLKLFYSLLSEDGKWSSPLPLPYNSSDYSVGHASISSDGKLLYFASDMPGGIGGVDLYKASIGENGEFGEPVNLGSNINTEGNEMFPFIHETNEMLFYSTDGSVGLGGLDVFVAQVLTDGEIGKTLNVGAPVNSHRDDFSFMMNDSQKEGYFASNRPGGKGDDDIYFVYIQKPFNFGKTMFGNFVDIDGNVINGFVYKVLNTDKEVLLEGMIEDEIDFVLHMDEDEMYTIEASKEGYISDSFQIDDSYSPEREFEVDFEMLKDPGLSFFTYIFDARTKEPIPGAEVIIKDEKTGTVKTFLTSENGDHEYPIMDKNIMDDGHYHIIINKEGYLSVNGNVDLTFEKEGRYNISEYMDIKMEEIVVGGDLSKIIDINPIYFDLNKYFIRPDAAIELDKIVKVMNENPTMVIELGSHTDSRGSDASNRTLSDRRAKASAKYIAERITNPERIYGKGYGESTPNTVDASADGGSATQLLTESFINPFKAKNRKLFDKYHQFNRRTEFIIIKM